MLAFFGILIWLAGTNAHLSAFHKGMYCENGTRKGVVNQNANDMVQPLWDLEFSQWWFHHVNGCDEIPPAPGDILQLPAGGSFTVEIADNQAFTHLSYGGKMTSAWPDGKPHPNFKDLLGTDCITSPNMHTLNQSMAAGTAFAISYESELSKVTQENLVIFSVAYNTPWQRLTTYHVPAKMPSCSAGGCTCAWTWIPNGCGEPNMYMQGFKCNVTGSTSTIPLATPKPPVWCEGAPNKCVKGAKQLIGWHQKTGNNINVTGYDLARQPKSPGYNMKCGFHNGAQNDIFAVPVSSSSPKSSSPKRRLADDDDNDDEDEDTNIVRTFPEDISSHRRNSPSYRAKIPRW